MESYVHDYGLIQTARICEMFFFSLFSRCEVHWMNQKGFTQKAMVKMIAGTMRGFFSGFFSHSGATWCHHLAFHK